ncbi:hypothetical protein A2U01_0016131, partial [Trifolium medium]|nr:hypothetical protein [Trifolium medium]
MSQITKVPLTVDMDVSKEEQDGRNTSGSPRILDLNTEVCGTRQSGGFGEKLGNDKESLSEKKEREDQGGDAVNTKGINVDLNAEDDTSSVNVEPASFQREHGHFQSKDVSESGSSAGPPKEKDSMRIWMEMKRNGFISSVHGGIPVPKKRGRKSKTEILEQKMELAKREQINRFTKIAAPSGLLNDLNPGIINHEQARSTSNEWRQARKSHATKNDSSWILEDKGCDRDRYSVEKAGLKNCVSNASHVTEDNVLSLKLSSSMKASMSSTSLSN